MRPAPRITCLALAIGLSLVVGPSTFAWTPSTSPSTGPATGTGKTATPGRPEVVDYDLGTVAIQQPSQARLHPDLVEMPVHLQGILAAPVGDGPFPVVLVMHGSYAFCTAMAMGDDPTPYPCPPENDLRQYQGFGELASALAADGYLVIVPDMAPEYTDGYGYAPFGDRAIQIADATLDALAVGSGFPADVPGRADLDRLVLVGHSRGGSLIVRYATDATARRTPRALALLTPAYLVGSSVIPTTMPTALVIAECDGDVGTEQPLMFLERQLPPLRTAPTLVYTIPDGTHNAFSTKLELERAPMCKDRELLAPGLQRAATAMVLASFFELALAVKGQ